MTDFVPRTCTEVPQSTSEASPKTVSLRDYRDTPALRVTGRSRSGQDNGIRS